MPKIIHNGITYAGLPDIDYDCEITTVTLYAANWSDGVYTISDARIDATSVQEFLPAVGITDTQLEALQAANIADGGQDAGHAYLKAYGDIPEIDIPIRIMFNPGVKTKEVDSNNPIVDGHEVKHIIKNLGKVWNGTSTVDVQHGITGITKVLSYVVCLVNDAGNAYQFPYVGATTAVQSSALYCTASALQLCANSSTNWANYDVILDIWYY